MPIERQINIDLRSEKVCTFLLDDKEQIFGATPSTPTGYKPSSVGKKDLPKQTTGNDFRLCTLKYEKYLILTDPGGVKYSEIEAVVVTRHTVSLNIYAVLFIKQNLSELHSNEIEQAFTNFNPSTDNLDDVESAIVGSGIPISAYRIVMSFELTKLNKVVNSDHRHAVIRMFGERYKLKLAGERYKCSADGLTLEGQDDVYDVKDPKTIKEIEERLKDTSELGEGCGTLAVVSEKLGAWDLPEFKTVSRSHDISFCGEVIGSWTHDVLRTRTRTHYIHGAVIAPEDSVKFYKKMFTDCLKSAALAAGIVAIITKGNLKLALLAFELEMYQCLKAIPDKYLKCIEIRLPVTSFTTAWTDV